VLQGVDVEERGDRRGPPLRRRDHLVQAGALVGGLRSREHGEPEPHPHRARVDHPHVDDEVTVGVEAVQRGGEHVRRRLGQEVGDRYLLGTDTERGLAREHDPVRIDDPPVAVFECGGSADQHYLVEPVVGDPPEPVETVPRVAP
jgi:hypothetical protein